MKWVILNSRSDYPDYDWTKWRKVLLVSEHTNTWRIWSWREPFTRLVHKHSPGEKIQEL